MRLLFIITNKGNGATKRKQPKALENVAKDLPKACLDNIVCSKDIQRTHLIIRIFIVIKARF